jgi:hypothetical protein
LQIGDFRKKAIRHSKKKENKQEEEKEEKEEESEPDTVDEDPVNLFLAVILMFSMTVTSLCQCHPLDLDINTKESIQSLKNPIPSPPTRFVMKKNKKLALTSEDSEVVINLIVFNLFTGTEHFALQAARKKYWNDKELIQTVRTSVRHDALAKHTKSKACIVEEYKSLTKDVGILFSLYVDE